MASGLKETVRYLYTGRSPGAARFRYALILFDAITIIYFIATAPLDPTPLLRAIDLALGVAIAADLLLRFWIAPSRRAYLGHLYVVADIIVVISIFAGLVVDLDLGFLRILRGLRLVHSYHLLRDLRAESRFFRLHEDAVVAATNLLVFVFFTSSLVHGLAGEIGEGTGSYVDALYFTVATLTTTGYGDITPVTPVGKLLSVAIMVVGVTLFVNLARAILLPSKVRHQCPDCGLIRHDPDAVHCKHCGRVLKIRTGGVT